MPALATITEHYSMRTLTFSDENFSIIDRFLSAWAGLPGEAWRDTRAAEKSQAPSDSEGQAGVDPLAALQPGATPLSNSQLIFSEIQIPYSVLSAFTALLNDLERILVSPHSAGQALRLALAYLHSLGIIALPAAAPAAPASEPRTVFSGNETRFSGLVQQQISGVTGSPRAPAALLPVDMPMPLRARRAAENAMRLARADTVAEGALGYIVREVTNTMIECRAVAVVEPAAQSGEPAAGAGAEEGSVRIGDPLTFEASKAVALDGPWVTAEQAHAIIGFTPTNDSFSTVNRVIRGCLNLGVVQLPPQRLAPGTTMPANACRVVRDALVVGDYSDWIAEEVVREVTDAMIDAGIVMPVPAAPAYMLKPGDTVHGAEGARVISTSMSGQEIAAMRVPRAAYERYPGEAWINPQRVSPSAYDYVVKQLIRVAKEFRVDVNMRTYASIADSIIAVRDIGVAERQRLAAALGDGWSPESPMLAVVDEAIARIGLLRKQREFSDGLVAQIDRLRKRLELRNADSREVIDAAFTVFDRFDASVEAEHAGVVNEEPTTFPLDIELHGRIAYRGNDREGRAQVPQLIIDNRTQLQRMRLQLAAHGKTELDALFERVDQIGEWTRRILLEKPSAGEVERMILRLPARSAEDTQAAIQTLNAQHLHEASVAPTTLTEADLDAGVPLSEPAQEVREWPRGSIGGMEWDNKEGRVEVLYMRDGKRRLLTLSTLKLGAAEMSAIRNYQFPFHAPIPDGAFISDEEIPHAP
jgi:hypothetical protein